LIDLAAKQRIDLAKQRLATIAACLAQFWHVGLNNLVARIHKAVAGGIERLLDSRVQVEFVGVLGEGDLDLAFGPRAVPAHRHHPRVARVVLDQRLHTGANISYLAADDALHRHDLGEQTAFRLLRRVPRRHPAKPRLDRGCPGCSCRIAQRAADIVAVGDGAHAGHDGC
jgi:hypothetical protein